MKQSMRQDGMSQEQGNQRQTQSPIQTQSLDDNNRPAEIDELDFEEEERPSKAGDTPDPDDDSTDDDLTPENLIAEDGARSSKEPGGVGSHGKI